ncbi:hypothetical protein CSPX01_10837 [Colletotrichum filicis]|nr:hypothetical protein CSPX01_10837 [Colletotrichum filicis]
MSLLIFGLSSVSPSIGLSLTSSGLTAGLAMVRAPSLSTMSGPATGHSSLDPECALVARWLCSPSV